MSLADGGGSAALADAQLSSARVVSDNLSIEAGSETAIEAALQWAADADALAVADVASAVAALAHLRNSQAGRAFMVIADTPQTAAGDRPSLPGNARWAVDVIRAGDEAAAASVLHVVTELLADVVVVPEVAGFVGLIDSNPSLTLVSANGDVLTLQCRQRR